MVVDGLSYAYRQNGDPRPVLKDLSFEVRAGEIFGLLGPNGAGKTTLIKILLDIVRPTTGEATLFNIPVRKPRARQRVGYLPENHRFPDFLTAGQMLDLYGRMAHVPAHERRQRIPPLLEAVRMTPWLDVKIKKFSKGMMQRLGLAQALLADADLIFLDEPTDGVDPVGRREIRDLLVQLRDQGKTIFLNSHLLSEVEQVCTRVAILNKGRLVREGSIEALTAIEPVYEVLSTPIPEGLLAALADAPEGAQLVWTPLAGGISESGDLGYTWGRYTFSNTDEAGEMEVSHGKYFTIWKVQDDGAWKVVLDGGNTNPPPEQ
ncbi:MAG: ATP-binding cassette domain-containing protein [Proteobacteria bacterium]|nr:ATP-binding cassette domain-containing protein [Pseudomonadota bacterium]